MIYLAPRWLAPYLLALLPCLGLAQEATHVSVQLGQNAIRVAGEAEIRASRAVAWETLTDYESWVGFLPDLQISRVVSRVPLRVAQRGTLPWLPGIPLVVLAEVVELPRERVRFSKLQGNLLFLEGEWRLSGKDGALRLSYLAEIMPGLSLPPNLSVDAVKSDTRAKVEAMAQEILRRERLHK